ncbi:hypothetical protein ABZ078_29975 [Streptomyces sp. NPDC006385]|uniref:hypothetical protein n=1 Tax=Streptomyces sp. NPDC006385 TaxID=3156761 RepID=UPI0033A0B9B7
MAGLRVGLEAALGVPVSACRRPGCVGQEGADEGKPRKADDRDADGLVQWRGLADGCTGSLVTRFTCDVTEGTDISIRFHPAASCSILSE